MKALRFIAPFCAAIVALAACSKVEEQSVQESIQGEGVPFSVMVSSTAGTRTANDGLNTKWVSTDKVSVFHAPAGGNYVLDGEFSIKDTETGLFDGTVTASPVEGNLYDWVAVYPYSPHLETVANTENCYFAVGSKSQDGFVQTQAETGSMAHLAGEYFPMVGKSAGVEYTGEAPFIQMNQIAAVAAFKVTNSTSADINVSNIEFTAPELIVGTFYIDFSQDTPVLRSSGNNYTTSTAILNITDGTIKKGETGIFYLGIRPFTVSSGQNLSLKVTTSANDSQTKTFNISSDVTFHPGKIKTLKMDFTTEHVEDLPSDYVFIESVNDITDGTYLIVNYDPVSEEESFVLKNQSLTSKTQSAIMLKDVEGLVISEDAKTINTCENNITWQFVSDGEGSFKIKSGARGSEDYLLCKDENTGLIISTWNYTSLQNVWSISQYSSGNNIYYNLSTVTGSRTRYLQTYLNGPDWRTYTSTNQGYNFIRLYRKGGAVSREPLAKPINVTAVLNTDDPEITNSIDVSWSTVENAGSYVVTATPEEGSARIVTVTENSVTFNDLAYETEYSITVVAKPLDLNTYSDSPASDPVTVVTGSLSGVSSTTFNVGTEIVSIFPATKDGIKFEYSKSGSVTDPAYFSPFRWYKNSTITISGGDAIIKAISFTLENGYEGEIVADSGSFVDSMWTGEANSVTFTNEGTAARFTSITVSYQGTGTCEVVTSTPTIAFSAAETSIEVGRSTATTVSTDSPATVVYSTNDPEVATVDENGVINALSEGTVIITATAPLFNNSFSIISAVSETVEITVTPKSENKKATLSITSGVTQNKTLEDDHNNSWSLTAVTEGWTSNDSYIHVGSGKKQATSITLTSSAYSNKTIKEIHVWAAAKADSNVTTKISIDGTLLGTSPVLGNTASSGGTEFSVTNTQNLSGEISVVISRPSSATGAIYFNKLEVIYTD